MGPLTIVIVNDFAHVQGGASQVALRSAQALADRGHSVHLVTAVGPVSPEFSPNVTVWSTQQQEIATDSSRLRAAVQGLWNAPAAALIRRVLRGHDPRTTLVHIHGWTKALSSSVVRAAVRCGVPVVATLHDYFSVCPNGGLFHYPKAELCRFTPMARACLASQCDKSGYGHKVWRVARQTIQARIGLMPSGLRACIVPSAFCHALLRPFLPSRVPLYVQSNMIDVDRQPPVAVRSNRAFMMVGRLSREKGPDIFAQASRDLPDGYEAVFVGDGDCRGQIAALNSRAHITGWCAADEVQRHLDRARALVFPSRLFEVQPLAVLEAAARGIPAIVADTSAARDQVHDGSTGLWFRSGDARDLADKLGRMTGDGVGEMGRAAYEAYWRHPLTVTAHVVGLEDIYQSVLNGH